MTDWLATAIYGPDRQGYWQQALGAAHQPDAAAPARDRIAELQHAITDDETRIQRQVVAVEAAETTPAVRQRINQRIQELEERLLATQATLRTLQAQEPSPPPDVATVAVLLAELPVHGGQLRSLDQATLRELLDSLDLRVTYDHARHAAHVEVMLVGDGGGVRRSGWRPHLATTRTKNRWSKAQSSGYRASTRRCDGKGTADILRDVRVCRSARMEDVDC